jgi:16S rRNA (guanine966-N2)-methyltransferase
MRCSQTRCDRFRHEAAAGTRVRVIAGRFRGRRLTAPSGGATRPTADRVREALFSMLGEISGARVLDLFAGTGALGIEALSRGASRAVFVERERRALTALRANLDALALGVPEAEVRAGDALSRLTRSVAAGERYDLIFLDPPYALAAELTERLCEPLEAALAPCGRIVLESGRGAPVGLSLTVVKERRYGDTSILILRAEVEGEPDC